VAEALTHDPLDPAALDRGTGVAFGYGHAESWAAVAAGQNDQEEERVGELAATRKNGRIGRLRQQPYRTRKRAGGNQQ
jgi:hypothetical protein